MYLINVFDKKLIKNLIDGFNKEFNKLKSYYD